MAVKLHLKMFFFFNGAHNVVGFDIGDCTCLIATCFLMLNIDS